MPFNFSHSSRNRLTGVNEGLVRVAFKALSYGIMDFSVVQGVRTQAEQDALYEQGRTKPGKIVTWTRNSKHLLQDDDTGHAIDIVPVIDGKMDWENIENFKFLATLFFRAAMEEGVQIKWLGHTKTSDWGHFEKGDKT